MKVSSIVVVGAALCAAFLSTAPPVSAAPATENVTTSSAPRGWSCPDPLATTLHDAGFRGTNLREAWAISMRESHGHARAISPTNDYGLFQFNKHAHRDADWWSDKDLLDPAYNASVAYRISEAGRTWYPWDISGKGQHLGRYSSRSVYNVYMKRYSEYPC